jgi:hypothetical protein
LFYKFHNFQGSADNGFSNRHLLAVQEVGASVSAGRGKKILKGTVPSASSSHHSTSASSRHTSSSDPTSHHATSASSSSHHPTTNATTQSHHSTIHLESHHNKRNCVDPDIEQFPKSLFSQTSRIHGAVIIHFLVAIYMFIGLAIVCDDYFVPCLQIMSSIFKLKDDIAGFVFNYHIFLIIFKNCYQIFVWFI